MGLAAAIIVSAVLGMLLVLVLLRHRDAPLAEALQQARQDLAAERTRIDRLTEALAHHGNVPLILPQSQPVQLEPSQGWWDTKRIDKPDTNVRQ